MNYINMVHFSILRNCLVTTEAVSNFNKCFGPGVASLKGNITRKTSDPVVTEYVEITQTTLYLNKKVTLTADVMFVNGIALFVSMPRGIKFTTLEYTPKRTKGILISSINKLISIYNFSGFNIITPLIDQEFD